MIAWLIKRYLPRLSEDVLKPILFELIQQGSRELIIWLDQVLSSEKTKRGLR